AKAEAAKQAKAEADAQAKEEAAAKAKIEAEAAAKAKAAAQSTESEQAKQAIKQKVNRSWIRPVSAEEGLKCTIRVKLMSDGTVIDAEVVSSSGDEIFDRSAENAVNKASPLPVPNDKELFAREFRTFSFLFNPK
ncbi:MAG: cell envelope integrity protein TolA, partial [Methylococcales bacterium]